ncbi:MAG: HAMP domain-containing sensor histidine kinase [Bacteroidales bacterium]|nr:HAMP domain-containing sensor histidine kinase [Bacteroidales bacterium]
MKLLNQSLLYLTLVFLVIIGIWSIIFYVNLKDEIRDSIDDGLDNNRLLILQKIKTDSTLLAQNKFGGNNFEIHPISKQKAHTFKEVYKDTLMYRLNEDDLEPVRILHSTFEHQNNYYEIKIISSLIEEDDLIEDSFWSIVWLFVILIASIIIVNNVVLRKIWNPFYVILERLKTYRLDKDDAPFEIETKTKEFIQLQEASNSLIKHSKEAYNSQKQFTENASHELQTPIAIITNKLELLLESQHLNKNDAKTIAEVINIADRLKKLNNTLLLLTKIENKQFFDEQTVCINENVKEIILNFQEIIDFKNINIVIEEIDNLYVKMDISLAEIILSNLIKNAIFHNIKAGKISIVIKKHEFTICNTGVMTAIDSKTIFNRFAKDQSKSLSTGLGLAVCKSVCKLYDSRISYSFSEKGHCFAVYFKNTI